MPRNISGNYTLPAGNPVVTDTLIETAWANPTLSDIAQALTDSLDRHGRGTMLAAFKVADGIESAPAVAFGSESSTGMYRDGAGVLGFSVLGSDRIRATSAGVQLLGTTTADAINVTGTLTAGLITGPVSPTNLVVSGNTTLGDAASDTVTINGTALAIPNSLNIDGSTLFIDAANNRVYTGNNTSFQTRFATATVDARFQVLGGTAAQSSMTLARFANDASEPIYFLAKSRSGTLGGHGLVASGDGLGIISWGGSDGAKIVEAARIRTVVSQAAALDSVTGELHFGTNEGTGAQPTVRLKIAHDGHVMPFGNNLYTLGIASLRWANVFSVLGDFSTQVTAPNLTATTQANIATGLYRAWSSTDTDIDALIGGTQGGVLIESQPSGHLTVGLRSNDLGDGFQVISKEAGNPTYTLKCFEVTANGHANLAGTLTANSVTATAGLVTTTGGVTVGNGVINHDPATGGQIDISHRPQDGTSLASVRLFRFTNTTGGASFQVLRGNNTTTADHIFSTGTSGVLARIALNGGRTLLSGATDDGVTALQVLGGVSAHSTVSATLPRFTFASDIDTGLGHPAADVVSAIVGGAEVARFIANGAGALVVGGSATNFAQAGRGVINIVGTTDQLVGFVTAPSTANGFLHATSTGGIIVSAAVAAQGVTLSPGGVSRFNINDTLASFTTTQLRVRRSTGVGSMDLFANTAGRTGHVAFVGQNDVRAGYIGDALDVGSADTGVLQYTAGTHNFSGLVNMVTGAGSLRVNGHISRFESAEQAMPTATGIVTVTHGGTRTPDYFYCYWRCKTAEHGWAVGDEIEVRNDISNTDREEQVLANATQIRWAHTGPVSAIRSSTGVSVALTAANWRAVFRAIWL